MSATYATASSTRIARRLCQELLEPIHLVSYMSDEPTEALQALGYEGYWMGYFAARSAPLGRVPAEVVDALFYNFAPGEVARCVPSCWNVATPEAVLAARRQGSVAALRRILGDRADSPALARAADVATRVAISAPMEGRSCTPRCGRSPYLTSRSPGSGTWRRCCASTVATATSPPWSRPASTGRRPMCSTPFPKA
jgi:hypothetical protein